jgi:2-polyprenyl-3-methyl-5-hydroxy-6-metoxy-1,4-benzoquinol methylase
VTYIDASYEAAPRRSSRRPGGQLAQSSRVSDAPQESSKSGNEEEERGVTELEQTRDAFVERLFRSSVEAMDVLAIYIGDRLNLYRTLAAGPLSPPALASAAGIDPRYAREWLEQQAATGVLSVDDASAPEDERRFSLPAAHADALIDPDSPFAMAPLCRSIAAAAHAAPAVVEAFRTGEGVAWDAYGADMIEAQGDFNRPWLLGSFATEHLASIPDVHARLRAGGRVADVACGVGWAGIAIALAYPSAVIDGFDSDDESISLARRNAARAGVADRALFHVRDASEPASRGRYDLAVVVEAVHDLSRPVEVLAAIRSMLKTDGSLIVADERTEDAFVAPAAETERLFYGYSILTCLPSAMHEKPSAATGTVMRRGTLERYASQAGFTDFTVLPVEHEFLRFYRLEP